MKRPQISLSNSLYILSDFSLQLSLRLTDALYSLLIYVVYISFFLNLHLTNIFNFYSQRQFFVLIYISGKLHFTTLNYALNYTLHPNVTFTVIFDGILLHVRSTCFLHVCLSPNSYSSQNLSSLPLTHLTHCPKREKTQIFFFFVLSLARKIHKRKRR